MRYATIIDGESRSFPANDPFTANSADTQGADVLIYSGRRYEADATRTAILVELGTECLGAHTGESMGGEGSNVVGFARYRNGDDPPSNLIELVRQPATLDTALAAARQILEEVGFVVVVSSDQAGRIIDRLIRPKYNAALRLLDEGLATQADMDLTCRLGLGYADGPIERVARGGLAYHHDVTKTLFETTGSPGYAPARRAVVAAQRRAGT